VRRGQSAIVPPVAALSTARKHCRQFTPAWINCFGPQSAVPRDPPAHAALLIAGCAAAIMAITDAKRSKAVQRCTPERMLYRFKPAGNRERYAFPAILTIRLSRQGPTCPHSQLQGTEPQSSALLRSGRVSWPNSRTIKGARPNACAWPAKPRTRPTRLCSSRWPKPGPGSLRRTKPEARTKNRNSAGSQPRPVNTIAFGAIAVCGPPRRIKSSSETPSVAHF